MIILKKVEYKKIVSLALSEFPNGPIYEKISYYSFTKTSIRNQGRKKKRKITNKNIQTNSNSDNDITERPNGN